MTYVSTHLRGWIPVLLFVGLIGLILILRPVLNQPAAVSTPIPTQPVAAAPSPSPKPARTLAPMLQPTPEPTPRPTAAPTVTPAPNTPQPVPVVPPSTPTPTDRSGGPIGPLLTPPPDWVPPTSQPGDVFVSGSFGQNLKAGGITVKTTRIAGETEGLGWCKLGLSEDDPPTTNYAWAGFLVTTTWSGFALDGGNAGSPGSYTPMTDCWHGDHPFASGTTYEVWLLVPAGSETTGPLTIVYFPNSSSPMYSFTFSG